MQVIKAPRRRRKESSSWRASYEARASATTSYSCRRYKQPAVVNINLQFDPTTPRAGKQTKLTCLDELIAGDHKLPESRITRLIVNQKEQGIQRLTIYA